MAGTRRSVSRWSSKLPGDEAIIRRDGGRLVIEPVRKRGLIALLKTMKPMEEDFSEIDDPVPRRAYIDLLHAGHEHHF